jgi:hypothetical protein
VSASVPPGAVDRITLPGRNVMPPVSLRAPLPARPRAAFSIGVSMGMRHLTRRATLLNGGLGLVLAGAGALVERSASKAGAVDRALDGTFGLLVPLVAFAVVREVTARSNLRRAAWPAARFGVARRDVALGLLAPALAVSGVLAVLMAAASVAFASSAAVPFAPRDLLVGVWAAALTSSAYVGWFALGSTFFARGGGRGVVLVADFVIGGSLGVAGAVLPRANASNLLGGAAPLGLAQAASTGILLASAVALCSLAAVRCRD